MRVEMPLKSYESSCRNSDYSEFCLNSQNQSESKRQLPDNDDKGKGWNEKEK